MLITDGAMEDFQDVFEEFNWPDRRVRRTRTLTDVLYACRKIKWQRLHPSTTFNVSSGPSVHLSDWARDDVCGKREMDRLQQQRWESIMRSKFNRSGLHENCFYFQKKKEGDKVYAGSLMRSHLMLFETGYQVVPSCELHRVMQRLRPEHNHFIML